MGRSLIQVLAGATLLTVDGDRRVFRDGAVAFDSDGVIRDVGPTEMVLDAAGPDAQVIRQDGSVITPGFVDAHVHLGEHLVRGLVPDGAAPREWLQEWLLPAYAGMRPDEEALGAELAIAEMLLSGTTTFCEAGTLLAWQSVADVVERSGIRGQLGRWTWDRPLAQEWMPTTTHAALEGAAELLDALHARGCTRLTPAVILLGIGTASEGLLRESAALAADRRVPLAMMYASVAPEHGGSPLAAAQLVACGWLRPGTKLTHAVYLSDADLALLTASGVSVAHCPSAALRHAKGLHRYGKVPEMLAAGMPVGLGGDSANGSNHLDMLTLMYLAATIYKDFRMDTAMVPPEAALEMATIHGARCLGLQDQIGSIEVGKQADLVVFSTDDPSWRPLLHPVQNLVLSASARSVESVWVAGRRVVQRGRLETIDVDALVPRVESAAQTLLGRIGLAVKEDWPAQKEDWPAQ